MAASQTPEASASLPRRPSSAAASAASILALGNRVGMGATQAVTDLHSIELNATKMVGFFHQP